MELIACSPNVELIQRLKIFVQRRLILIPQMDFVFAQFSGPLDLLLSLLDEKKMSITDLSLSSVTEQYLQQLETVTNENADDLADFLVVAARLLLLKTRALLPNLDEADEDGPSLAEQLRLYRAFLAASVSLNNLWLANERAVFRVEPPRPVFGFVPPQNVSLDSLKNSFVNLLERIRPPKPLPQTTIDRSVSLKETIAKMRAALVVAQKISFHKLVGSSRTEVVVGFLALLELVKQQTINIRQDSPFGEIVAELV